MSGEVKVKMYVEKRNGRQEEIVVDKITLRIQKLCYGLDTEYIEPPSVTAKVTYRLYNGIPTEEIDEYAADAAAAMTFEHNDYAVLAARIAISSLHKSTKKSFSQVMTDLHSYTDPETNEPKPMISEFHYDIIMENAGILDSTIIYERDYNYNYEGFLTLEKSYLMKIDGRVVERPQHMLMRVAIGIHGKDIYSAIQTYNLMSEKYFIHSSQTMMNAATCKPYLSSCYMFGIRDDTLEGVYNTVKQCALISKCSGSIAVDIHYVRAKPFPVIEKKGRMTTNGGTVGVISLLKVLNDTAKYVEQGGTRPGAVGVYLEPWHPDIYEFLNLIKDIAKDENRERDFFLTIWIPDLFMERVLHDKDWSLMCPKKCPGLADCWGEEFSNVYASYEKHGTVLKRVKARELFRDIYSTQVETGYPFMMFKDACNKKSNQQNLGTVKASSLFTESVQYFSQGDLTASNQASIAVNMFVRADRTYDFIKLKTVVKTVTKNLDKIIDAASYPVPSAERTSKRHRPIGIGVHGLADAFLLMRYPYCSPEARQLNSQIFETLYYGALEASCELATEHGSYQTYNGSPVSRGILQYDMWDVTPTDLWDWSALKKKIAENGVRNSLLISAMPTETASQIMGNSESFEPYASFKYDVKTYSDDIQVVHNLLVRDLSDHNLWSEEMKRKIINNGGSIQKIDEIPRKLRELYRTAFDLPLKGYMEMAAERGAFIDQTQSLNIFTRQPSLAFMNCVHFFAWKLGLKTGMYHLKSILPPRPLRANPGDGGPPRDDGDDDDDEDDNDDNSDNGDYGGCSLGHRGCCRACHA